MRRFLFSSALALLALVALAASASAATAPAITSVSPKEVQIGQKLVINGKNFKKGVRNNRLFFFRASDGKAVRVRPSKASSTRRLEVKVPDTLAVLLTVVNGNPAPTRFQLQVFSGKLSKKLARAKSPIVSPAGAVQSPGGTPGTPPPPPDCDTDGTPDAQDADDDNDGLTDDLETAIKTNVCNKDTDADGVDDGFEYWSALDLNGTPNYAGKVPYPNPLDGTDGGTDFDGDGMTQSEEFAAAKATGTVTSSPLTYSDGNQTSAAAGNSGAMDLDENGRITDEEKDADNDGLANWLELVKGEADPTGGCTYAPSTDSGYGSYGNAFTDCGSGPMPNGRTFGKLESGKTATGGAAPVFSQVNILKYLDPDSDGDTIPDAADDQDFDGLSNIEEITAGTDGKFTIPKDPCDPNPDARSCPTHASHT